MQNDWVRWQLSHFVESIRACTGCRVMKSLGWTESGFCSESWQLWHSFSAWHSMHAMRSIDARVPCVNS